jgi:hypothetical protein
MVCRHLLLFSVTVFALIFMDSKLYGESRKIDLLVYYERGFFNRVYTQQEYRENREDTFSVNLESWGMEFKLRNQGGEIRGAGFSMSRISGGSIYNYDRYERQPGTLNALPYFFIGYDFDWWALETGLGYYLSWIESEPVCYYRPDGTTRQVSGGGMRLIRGESFTVLNVMIRLLREDMPHFKVRLGRERFNLVDSLFNLGFVVPMGSHNFELYISLPVDIFPSMPVCGRRYGLSYSYSMGNLLAGVTAGYLAHNEKGGGDGNMHLLDPGNFSIGVFTGFRI